MPKMFGQLLLYSFERAGKALEESGDDACVEPPVPIPNTAVKHARAEGTWLETAWENRSLPVYFYGGCGEVVNTLDCGSSMHGFDPHHSPHCKNRLSGNVLFD